MPAKKKQESGPEASGPEQGKTSATGGQESETGRETHTEDRSEQAEQVIRQHVGYSLVAGALPIPLIDIAAVTVIQVDMLHKLADLYDVAFDQARGRSVIASLIGATGGHMIGRLGASLVKGIPGIGSLLGIGSQIVLAGASTYAVGKVFQDHFSRGGTLATFDARSWQAPFERFFSSGQTVAQKMKENQDHEDIVETLKKLKELRDSGAISEQEYQETKAGLLQKLKS